MLHTISGHNFHGYYSVRVRAPKEGGRMNDQQLRRIYQALCGMNDCMCGGGYGNGPDTNSATIDQDGILHPANCHCPEHA